MPQILRGAIERAIRIPPLSLQGDLVVPENATGLVIFAMAAAVAEKARVINMWLGS